MSITIDLPAPVLAALQEESDATGQPIEQVAVEVLSQRFFIDKSDGKPDMAIVAIIEEAFEDARAGRLLTMEQVDANVDAALAEARERRRQKQQREPDAE